MSFIEKLNVTHVFLFGVPFIKGSTVTHKLNETQYVVCTLVNNK